MYNNDKTGEMKFTTVSSKFTRRQDENIVKVLSLNSDEQLIYRMIKFIKYVLD
jgi:hypothetical protein